MSREVRVFAEGAARWVQASGTGGWATGSAATTALVGFVQVGLNEKSAQTIVTPLERGIPHHHKVVAKAPIAFSLSYLQAVTANMANPATASGASTPQVHWEVRQQDNEVAVGSAQFFQFMNCVLQDRGWTEGENGNVFQENWMALTMTGPTASGYLA